MSGSLKWSARDVALCWLVWGIVAITPGNGGRVAVSVLNA